MTFQRSISFACALSLGLGLAACGPSGGDDDEETRSTAQSSSGSVSDNPDEFEQGHQTTQQVLDKGSERARQQTSGSAGGGSQVETNQQGLAHARQRQQQGQSGPIPQFTVNCEQDGSAQFSGSYSSQRTGQQGFESNYNLNSRFNNCREDGVGVSGDLNYNFTLRAQQSQNQQQEPSLNFILTMKGQLDYSGEASGTCGYDLTIRFNGGSLFGGSFDMGSSETPQQSDSSGSTAETSLDISGSACGHSARELEQLDLQEGSSDNDTTTSPDAGPPSGDTGIGHGGSADAGIGDFGDAGF